MSDDALIEEIRDHASALNLALAISARAPGGLIGALARLLVESGCTVEVDGLNLNVQLPAAPRVVTFDINFSVDDAGGPTS